MIPEHHDHGGKVLVVEDDNDVRDALIFALELEGYFAMAAANGLEALEVLRRDPRYCLILLDLMMPVMDGTSFLSAMKLDPRVAHIPVVVVSADPNGKQKAEMHNAASFIRKPAKLSDLVNALERYC